MEPTAAGSLFADLRSSTLLCIPAAGKKRDAVLAILNSLDTRELQRQVDAYLYRRGGR